MPEAGDRLQALTRAVRAPRLVKLLRDVVEQYSPSYAEEPAMEVFAEALRDAGIPYLRQPVPERTHGEQHGNLVVELGPKPVELLWVGHLDTVAVTEEGQLTPRREGDLLYGLGTADMKGGCAAMAEALMALADADVELQRGFAAAFVVGEEEYGDGAKALLSHLRAPLTVVGEPTGLVPCLDHFGYYEYRFEVQGNQVHAALPELGASAIHAMLEWLTALYEGARSSPHAELLAVNPREIAGGGDTFVVAEHCEAFVDIHGGPDTGRRQIDRLVTAARERAAQSHGACTLRHERVFTAEGYALDEADSRLGPLKRAFAHTGLEWTPGPFRSHSDANAFHAAGSFPVVCGPGRLEVAHTRHEHVALGEVRRAAELYAAMVLEVCGT